MKKKIYLVLIIVLLLVTACSLSTTSTDNKKDTKPKTTEKSVLDHEYYKGLTLEDIVSVEKVFYGEGGEETESFTEQEDIERIYNMWKNTKLGKETNQACEDNTTVYIFKLKDNATISIEKECDWVVINNKRYLIK